MTCGSASSRSSQRTLHMGDGGHGSRVACACDTYGRSGAAAHACCADRAGMHAAHARHRRWRTRIRSTHASVGLRLLGARPQHPTHCLPLRLAAPSNVLGERSESRLIEAAARRRRLLRADSRRSPRSPSCTPPSPGTAPRAAARPTARRTKTRAPPGRKAR